MEQETRTQNWI